MKRLKHSGVQAFLAERQGLLNLYDKAKLQMGDDYVKTEHGNVAENAFRNWLNAFLPKRFAATKGYIITPRLEHNMPLEEWDIIIYDALESPILFSKESSNQAIPIEYVRAVIEVKSTLNPKNAKLATNKLIKLKHFIGTNTSLRYPNYLCSPFTSSVVFFETAVSKLKDYRNALNNLSVICQQESYIPFMGGLVLRSQKDESHSGYLQSCISDTPINFPDHLELSSSFHYPNGKHGSFGCLAYGVNNFSNFTFDLLEYIKGSKDKGVSSFYGIDFENIRGSRLFS
jgi:hypothetical protein